MRISAGYQTEWMTRRIPVNAPPNRLPAGTGPGRGVLADEDPARGEDPLVSSDEIIDQNVEMHQRGRSGRGSGPGAGTGAGAGAGALERKPLTMRGRLQGDPARIPLDRRPAEQAGPEASQPPRIRAVQHDLAYPADHVMVFAAHQPMMTDAPQAGSQSSG